MTSKHLAALGFALLIVSATLACGWSGTPSHSEPDATTTTSASPVSPASALLASAMRLASDGHGAQADFSWDIQRDGLHINGDGTYVVTAAGELQHEAHYRGDGNVPSRFTEANDSQIILLADAAFVLSPPLGRDWVRFSPQEFGADWAVVQRLSANRSPVDYSAVTGAAAVDAADRGSDSIDGRMYERYGGTVDANVLMEALADSYGSQGQIMFANRFSGPVETDIWVDPATSLPRRIRADGHITYLGANTHVVLSVEYNDFDAASAVTAPRDYKTLSDLAQSQ